jgi:uncharacterized paraquat-inducible protein A
LTVPAKVEGVSAMLTHQHCYHHRLREAVVRCPDCRRFFCRECVTEHDDRMLCSQCLGRLTGSRQASARRWIHAMAPALQGLFGFILLWYLFYLAGLTLVAIPHAFHEGTVWESGWWSGK